MRLVCLLSIAALMMCAGCRDSGRFPTYSAGGFVHFPDGRPLAGGAVICESPHGLAARAVIQEDGTFILGTYDTADGAVEGKHRVAIRPPTSVGVDAGGGGRRRSISPIDQRFLSLETSGIVLEVKPGGENRFEIEVAAPAVQK
jgi:hypothetical protein